MSFLVDTTILIDHLRGRPEAQSWLLSTQTEGLAISVIARAEVLSGMKPEEELATRLLLNQLPLLSIEVRVADTAASYRRVYGKSHQLLLPDALIAATAKIHGMTLATLNTRDFPMTDINVLRPY